jgi:hypothetical protein
MVKIEVPLHNSFLVGKFDFIAQDRAILHTIRLLQGHSNVLLVRIARFCIPFAFGKVSLVCQKKKAH